MDLENIKIYFATQKMQKEDTPIWKSCKELGLGRNLVAYINNKRPLSVVYNEALRFHYNYKNTPEAAIFVHDDVWLEHDPRPKLEKLFKEFDIVGVAGCSKAEIKSPALWHLMGGGFQGGHLHGAVGHSHGKQKHVTGFGPFPQRVVMIDGVFMAFNREAMAKARFDENCPSAFHMYDLNLCASALEKGLKIGVGDIMITHESPGLREWTEDWKAGEKYYLETYGN
jgi:hypothetical protein